MKILENNNIEESLHTKFLSNTPHGVIIVNNKGEFVFGNNKVIPIKPEQINNYMLHKGTKNYGMFDGERRRKLKPDETPLAIALNGERVTGIKVYVENKVVPNGMYLRVSSFPIHNENKEIIAAGATFEDITEEQLIYESLIIKIEEFQKYISDGTYEEINKSTRSIS